MPGLQFAVAEPSNEAGQAPEQSFLHAVEHLHLDLLPEDSTKQELFVDS